MKVPASLARQNTWLLAGAFIVIELLTLALFIALVLAPMARRSSSDLAGLMVLSAQTWAELPPQTREAFETELMRSHTLALRDAAPSGAPDAWHPPFFRLLEDALAQRLGKAQHLSSETVGGELWYWINLPAGPRDLGVGLPQSRIESQFVLALIASLLIALALAIAFAVGLARRITAPLARLERASELVGEGKEPLLLPEDGPRELVAVSRRFNAMAQQVRELLSARTTLLAGVSHDLRTPLARMRLTLELLRMPHDEGLIERLERDIEQMNRLIGNVLDLARGLEHEPTVVTDLPEFLMEVAEDFSTSTSQVRVSCPSGHFAIARFALHRALGNLLQNVLRYAPEAPAELVCELDDKHCRIGVLDRGPGIAPTQIEAMFQPFQRLDPSRSPVTGGSGLGLAIVRELARANGWEVSLSARPGGGLQAWIEIPRVS